jgi:peroxiredoxin
LTLLHNSDELIHVWSQRMLGDNLSEETESLLKQNEFILQQNVAANILIAARLAEQPAQAQRLRTFIESDPPRDAWRKIQSRYWLDRGRLALLDGRKADERTDYSKALELHKTPNPIEGRTIYDLVAEASVLGLRNASDFQPALDPGWQTPRKGMPAFELTDLAGKVWRLKDLAGRAVLISVWATWCGRCQRELPHIQNLYNQSKSRADLQILTFSLDEDPGVLPAFLKGKGYNFPVLPANAFVTQLLDMVAIPQTWIIDPSGKWRWTGTPNTSDADWEAAVLRQVETVKGK